MEVGGLTQEKNGKLSQNSPILVVIFWGSILCVFCVCVYALLNVVSHYSLRVLSMSMMGFPKKWNRGVG